MMKNASQTPKISILLHDIRSVHNVGSIFRTADAFGVAKLYFSGYTPAPTDRFGRMRSDIEKVALGAEKTVAWEVVGEAAGSVVDFIKERKAAGVIVVALEQDTRSISFTQAREKFAAVEDEAGILLILGNEVGGVDKNLLDLADVIVEIPMQGKKESLNVSVATGIALFGITNK